MTKSLDQLRRDAKALAKQYDALDPAAHARAGAVAKARGAAPLKHADFLQVIANENGFVSWPKLVWASETVGLDRAAKQQRLKIALIHGQHWRVDQLLADTPDLADGVFDIEVALLRRGAVEAALADEPALATRVFGLRRPIVILAFSKHIHAAPEREADMLAIADALIASGADVNDGFVDPGAGPEPLSALYGAIGHAHNMALGRWLLDNGANPNDGESLYHATEIGHADGLRILLQHGADPSGTNALKRAMDFDSLEMVQILLDAGADPNEGHQGWGALHHAALRNVSAPVCRAVLAAGGDPAQVGQGITAYAAARVYGHLPLIGLLEPQALTPEETLLAQATTGVVPDGVYIDTAKLPSIYLDLVAEFAGDPVRLDHIKALIKLGLPWDKGAAMDVPPVQLAGWQGQPEMLRYFLSLSPDLGHINGYGGTLLSTIVHGSENNPERAERDYISCLEIALTEGVALPKRAAEFAGVPEVAAFLADWAEAHPGQVVEHGVV